MRATGKSSAYIKIAEGCDHPCSFCVIPNLRGKFRSRRFASVVAEAEQLAAQGVRELTLIGQDTTCYGEDLGMKDGLAQLLDTLARIPDLKWLRFLYAYPNKITGRLLETIAQHDTICKYLDMPLQHASASVLKSMRRGGNAEIFLKTIERVRATVPDVAIRTTFITGFPGETEADFAVLGDFIRQARLDWLGVFSYSDEEGSGAFHLGDKVPPRTIEARRRSLMRQQQAISRKSRASLVGRHSNSWSKDRLKRLRSYGKGARSIRLPRSMERSISTTLDPSISCIPGSFTNARSPSRRIMTWWAELSCKGTL